MSRFAFTTNQDEWLAKLRDLTGLDYHEDLTRQVANKVSRAHGCVYMFSHTIMDQYRQSILAQSIIVPIATLHEALDHTSVYVHVQYLYCVAQHHPGWMKIRGHFARM